MDQTMSYQQMRSEESVKSLEFYSIQNIIRLLKKNELIVLRLTACLIAVVGLIGIISITVQCQEKDYLHGNHQAKQKRTSNEIIKKKIYVSSNHKELVAQFSSFVI